MSTVLEAPRRAVGADASPAPRGQDARHRTAADGALALPVRFAAFSALVVYGCEHWVRQVAPTDTGLALRMAAVAIALALGLTLAGGLRRDRTRRIAIVLLCVVGTVAALTAAGIPLRFAGWRNWDALATGVGQGLETLPNLNVPYRGLDEWVRWTIACGAALLGVLAAALAFTPAVTLHGAQTVLLDVQASLRLFGGLAALQERLQATLAPLGHRLQMAAAPTALGAALLAQWFPRPAPGRGDLVLGAHATQLPALQALLTEAPLGLLSPVREHADALLGMGLHTLHDLQQLPRAGLARRFGTAVLDELDSALGRRADPRRLKRRLHGNHLEISRPLGAECAGDKFVLGR